MSGHLLSFVTALAVSLVLCGLVRWVARRRGLHVPSLVADKRVEETVDEAQRHVEEIEHVAAEPSLVCPACGETLTVSDALVHEHLTRQPAPAKRGRTAKARA